MRYAQANYPDDKLVLYGHSLGGSIAIHVLSEAVKRKGKRIDGLILENPLPSIPWMVQSLYPQKWLPYHYLGGLAFDRWDTFPILAKQLIEPERILWVRSKNDEIVPRSNKQGEGVEGMYDLAGGKFVELDALHDNAYRERRWKLEIREFLSKLTLQSNP